MTKGPLRTGNLQNYIWVDLSHIFNIAQDYINLAQGWGYNTNCSSAIDQVFFLCSDTEHSESFLSLLFPVYSCSLLNSSPQTVKKPQQVSLKKLIQHVAVI